MTAQTIAVIAVSQTSIRVVLNADRIVYQGRWEAIPSWFDIKRADKAYYAEYKLLALYMHRRQVGQNGVQVFENREVA